VHETEATPIFYPTGVIEGNAAELPRLTGGALPVRVREAVASAAQRCSSSTPKARRDERRADPAHRVDDKRAGSCVGGDSAAGEFGQHLRRVAVRLGEVAAAPLLLACLLGARPDRERQLGRIVAIVASERTSFAALSLLPLQIDHFRAPCDPPSPRRWESGRPVRAENSVRLAEGLRRRPVRFSKSAAARGACNNPART
jgi:hypothetical protein